MNVVAEERPMRPPAPMPHLLTIDEVAKIARRTSKAMRQVRQRDIVHAAKGEPLEGPRWRKIGGRVFVAEHDLAIWLEGEDA